jgi:hypothetical protein
MSQFSHLSIHEAEQFKIFVKELYTQKKIKLKIYTYKVEPKPRLLQLLEENTVLRDIKMSSSLCYERTQKRENNVTVFSHNTRKRTFYCL